jgi:hypothetical protein
VTKQAMTNIEIYRKRISALIFMSATPILAVSPFLIGWLGSLITPGCTNEANCGWAALPWLMFLTIPGGVVFFILGLIRFFATLGNRIIKSTQVTPQERRLKRYQFAWMATASGPLVLVLAIVLSLFAGPIEICNDNDVCTQTANGAFVGALMIGAPTLIAASWLYLLGVAIWNRLDKNASAGN